MSVGSIGSTATMRALAAPTRGKGTGAAAGEPAAAVESFRELMKMTPAERMRAALLGKMGLTEESLRNLGAEERRKIEDTIKARIKDSLTGTLETPARGLFTDIRA
ncbi:hypothetical protein J2X36_002335 [Methylobacterium sp. BE186]|uniref:hypothetical protein n=1 Tax=Methylobacterium sp. BE186 TaxID=2817715 RepID=UPI002866D241|nr:hypothetical protein [Methylobacterium sp. BE186]MDR7037588.1 hypothetical protein [Methylobacterium sp. BE186]